MAAKIHDKQNRFKDHFSSTQCIWSQTIAKISELKRIVATASLFTSLSSLLSLALLTHKNMLAWKMIFFKQRANSRDAFCRPFRFHYRDTSLSNLLILIHFLNVFQSKQFFINVLLQYSENFSINSHKLSAILKLNSVYFYTNIINCRYNNF